LTSPAAKASAHFIVSRDGRIVNQLVDCNTVAWHAGESAWKGQTGCNRFSIGVEIDNGGACQKLGDGRFRSLATGDIVDPANIVEGQQNGCAWNYWESYPSKQIDLVTTVCREILAAYPSIVDIAGHSEIAPGRKQDPGVAFPMDHFKSVLFGRS
jgi:N-acetylmuramoyl-L-alanine amidase